MVKKIFGVMSIVVIFFSCQKEGIIPEVDGGSRPELVETRVARSSQNEIYSVSLANFTPLRQRGMTCGPLLMLLLDI